MKKTVSVFIAMVFLLWSVKATAQWYHDKATEAEMQARDLPYSILQKQIDSKLCDADWEAGSPFLLIKNNPDKEIATRGKGIHYFTLESWGDACIISLRQNSPLDKPINDSTALASKRMAAAMQDGLAQAKKAMENAQKNGGKLPAADRAQIQKDSLINIQSLAMLAHLQNQQHLAVLSLFINAEWTNDEKTGAGSFFANSFKILQIPGVKQAVISIEFPDKKHPDVSPDTTYFASLYIGNWNKPDLKRMLPYPFKYHTKYAWIDRTHSGPPIVENFKINITSYHYIWLMKVVQSIDWTKLEALVKK